MASNQQHNSSPKNEVELGTVAALMPAENGRRRRYPSFHLQDGLGGLLNTALHPGVAPISQRPPVINRGSCGRMIIGSRRNSTAAAAAYHGEREDEMKISRRKAMYQEDRLFSGAPDALESSDYRDYHDGSDYHDDYDDEIGDQVDGRQSCSPSDYLDDYDYESLYQVDRRQARSPSPSLAFASVAIKFCILCAILSWIGLLGLGGFAPQQPASPLDLVTAAIPGLSYFLPVKGSPQDAVADGDTSGSDQEDVGPRPGFVYEHPYVSSSYYTSTKSMQTLISTQDGQVMRNLRREAEQVSGMDSSSAELKTRLAIVRPFCEFDAEGKTLLDNSTDCNCGAFKTEDDCAESGVGCIWRPLFESCHPPELIDGGEHICAPSDPSTMSPNMSLPEDDTQSLASSSIQETRSEDDSSYSAMFKSREHESSTSKTNSTEDFTSMEDDDHDAILEPTTHTNQGMKLEEDTRDPWYETNTSARKRMGMFGISDKPTTQHHGHVTTTHDYAETPSLQDVHTQILLLEEMLKEERKLEVLMQGIQAAEKEQNTRDPGSGEEKNGLVGDQYVRGTTHA